MRARWCHGVVAVPAEDYGHPSLHGMAGSVHADKQASNHGLEAKQGWRLDETATPLLKVASVPPVPNRGSPLGTPRTRFSGTGRPHWTGRWATAAREMYRLGPLKEPLRPLKSSTPLACPAGGPPFPSLGSFPSSLTAPLLLLALVSLHPPRHPSIPSIALVISPHLIFPFFLNARFLLLLPLSHQRRYFARQASLLALKY